MGTDLAARVATRAFHVVNHVSRIRRHGNRIHGTMLRAECATGAVGVDRIFDERGAFTGRAASLQMCFILIPKVAQRGEDWIRRRLAQAAQAAEAEESPIPVTPQPVVTPTTPPIEPSKPSPIDAELAEIRAQYPVKEEKPLPTKPEPDPSLKFFVELRNLLQSRLDQLKEREKDMETTFARRVLRLQAEGIGAASMIGLGIGDEFVEYLMGSKVRSLGKLLPRVARMYLRDPQEEGLLYLVTFEHHAGDLTVSVGNTYLR